MAAITGTYGLVRYLSVSFTVTPTTASDTISNADLLTTSGLAAVTPTFLSPLRTFLTNTYASAAAAELAFRAIGGRIEVRQPSGAVLDAPLVVWSAAGPSVPFLTVTTVAIGVTQLLEIRIWVPHSIIQ